MSQGQAALNATTTCLRLKPDGMADKLPVGPDFWPDLIAGKLGDFHHEYLVTTFSFDQNWSSWEIHPNGDEVVFLLGGAVDFILDTAEGSRSSKCVVPGTTPWYQRVHGTLPTRCSRA